MSAKCNYCKINIYDETGQCYGEEFSVGKVVCDQCLNSIAGLHRVLYVTMISLGIGFRMDDVLTLAIEVHKHELESGNQ